MFLGLMTGFTRMGVGAHFLSDVLFAGVLTFLVSYLLGLVFFVRRPNRLSIRFTRGTKHAPVNDGATQNGTES
jgi:membrane-associated phospholipid phosphatase